MGILWFLPVESRRWRPVSHLDKPRLFSFVATFWIFHLALYQFTVKVSRTLSPKKKSPDSYVDTSITLVRISIFFFKKKRELQHLVFPCSHLPQYWQGHYWLNFGDRTGSGVFQHVWPQMSGMSEIRSCSVYSHFNSGMQQDLYSHFK